jgi:Mrp family chromosome partitioning ATPase
MSIEQALEKLKRKSAAQGDSRNLPASVTRSSNRREQRPARSDLPPLREFPVVACTPDVAVARHVLLPGTILAANERITAAYRIIRARLLHRIQANNWTTIAVTSPEAGEGKTLTSINLALSLARDLTHNVFLIDLDLRNPSVCAYLGVQPPQELLAYFSSGGPAQAPLFSIGVENLAIAGSVTPSNLGSDLLGDGRLERLIDEIKGFARSPVVLLDLPPILVTDEALSLAPKVDATLLTVAEGKTRRDSLLRTKQLLAEFTSAGIVLNRSREELHRTGYYAYE